jgi:tRNA threonylcarbamoyl adenosine modification protein (Sua5/YciO/YrdC/YwlC family)
LVMNSKVVDIITDSPDQRCVDLAVEKLHGGGIISYPTDTVYGMGTSITNVRAIEQIDRIKRIVNKKLLSIICKDLKDITQYAYVSNQAYKIMRRCLPGPYTFILPSTSQTPKRLSHKRRTVGIRIPDNALIQSLILTLGSPLINTSVPAGPDEILNDPYEIERRIGNDLDLILNGGILISEPSTVVDLTDYAPQIIREGAGDTSLIY